MLQQAPTQIRFCLETPAFGVWVYPELKKTRSGCPLTQTHKTDKHTCGFIYLYILRVFHTNRHTVRLTYTHTYQRKQPSGIWHIKSDHNIASGLLMDLHVLVHQNMLFSLPQLAF